MLHEIVWDTPFDILYGIVTLPKNSVFYRGHSTKYDTISERPAYFSSKTLAQSYVRNPEYKLSMFKATRPLRLLDVRFMMSMLRDLFTSNPKKAANVSVVLSFGLCSLRHQVHLLNQRYRQNRDISTPEGCANSSISTALPLYFEQQAHPSDVLTSRKQRYKDINEGHKHLQEIVAKLDPLSIIEEQGVRIGETWNDAETMAFLQHLFDGFVDGYISPRLHTPYHVSNGGTMLPEMILFNPKKSDIMEITGSNDLYPVSIQTICELQAKQFNIKSDSDSNMTFYLSKMVGGGDDDGGGNNVYIPTVEQINEKWEDPDIQTRINDGFLSAQLWKEHFIFDRFTRNALETTTRTKKPNESETSKQYINHPAPMVPITPWSVVEQQMKERMKELKKHKTRKVRKRV